MTALPLLLAVVGQGADAGRDDAIFEEGADGGRDDAVFGEGAAPGDDGAPAPAAAPSAEERLGARLAETQDPLAIGGLLFQRLQASRTEGLDAGDTALDAPTLLDVYLDGRPNDRVRAYLRSRLTHDAAAGVDPALSLDQLWLKLDVARTVYLTVGRQPIRWGVGRIWNPTDFLMPVRDPLAIVDERVGRSFVKAHLPLEGLGWNLYAVGELEDARTLEDAGGALRAEILLGPAELAVTGERRGADGPWRYGADASAAAGPVDLRAEAASDSDTREVRAVAAVEWSFNYSDEDAATVGLEALHNGRPEPLTLYASERAAAAYLVLPAPGSWNDTVVIANGIADVGTDDLAVGRQSWIARLDWQVRVLTYLDVDLYAMQGHVRPGDAPGITFQQAGAGLRVSM